MAAGSAFGPPQPELGGTVSGRSPEPSLCMTQSELCTSGVTCRENAISFPCGDQLNVQQLADTVGGSSSCFFGCGGPGGAQIGIQKADTEQGAFAAGVSLQNAVNSNAPHSVAGGNIYAGPSSANQWASSEAEGKAFNDADTFQWASQYQKVG